MYTNLCCVESWWCAGGVLLLFYYWCEWASGWVHWFHTSMWNDCPVNRLHSYGYYIWVINRVILYSNVYYIHHICIFCIAIVYVYCSRNENINYCCCCRFLFVAEKKNMIQRPKMFLLYFYSSFRSNHFYFVHIFRNRSPNTMGYWKGVFCGSRMYRMRAYVSCMLCSLLAIEREGVA